jgi:hypothetical protein
VKAAHERPVDRKLEPVAAAGEVLVELPPHRVEPLGGEEDARRDAVRELLEDLVARLVLEREAHEAARRRRREERPEGGVHGREGHVEQSLLVCPAGELGHASHLLHSFLMLARPARTFWRAAASEQPMIFPMRA